MDINVAPSFGFGPGQKIELASEIERELGFAFDRRKIPEALAGYLEKHGPTFLELFIGGHSFPGIYQGTSEDLTNVIMPAIFPGARAHYSGASQTEKYTWRNRPAFHRGIIEGFRPITRSFLEAYASGFENVAHLGKYMPETDEPIKPEDTQSPTQ